MSEERKTKLRMNLAAIQKADPYAKEILDSSSHVAYYKFKNNEWEKSEIEGAFFVYSRLAEPFHSIFINNRLHTQPLMEPILPQIQLQEQSPFLLYRSQKNQIFGFWFYSKEDCKRIYNLIMNIVKRTTNPNANRPQPQDESRSAKKDDVDIFSMLSQAQQSFMSSSPNQQPPPPQQIFIQPPQTQQEIPMSRIMHQNPAGPDITAPVMNFFAAAQKPLNNVVVNPPKIDNHVVVVHQQQPPQIVNKSVNACPTVDEIEKLHRQISISPKPLQQASVPVIANPIIQSRVIDMKPKGPTLVTPNMLMKSSSDNKVTSVSVPQPKPLDSQQLLQAIRYLLDNDPEFIRKIHDTYVKNFQHNNSHH